MMRQEPGYYYQSDGPRLTDSNTLLLKIDELQVQYFETVATGDACLYRSMVT